MIGLNGMPPQICLLNPSRSKLFASCNSYLGMRLICAKDSICRKIKRNASACNLHDLYGLATLGCVDHSDPVLRSIGYVEFLIGKEYLS